MSAQILHKQVILHPDTQADREYTSADQYSSAALHALKRHQLVSLSKRYGLKASGKNVDMIERLQAHALTLPTDADFHIPEPEPTPAPSRILRSANTPSVRTPTAFPFSESGPIINEPYAGSDGSPTPTKVRHNPARHVATAPLGAAPNDEQSFVLPDTLGPQSQLNHKASIISTVSASWSILSESDASIMENAQGGGDAGGSGMGSLRGWKSAGNGEALLDFGIPGERPDFGTHISANSRSRSAGSRNSLFALASSITRSGSRALRSRPSAAPSAHTLMSTSADSDTGRPTTPTRQLGSTDGGEEAEEVVQSTTAPSPASTIGIPRRHSKMTLIERPSTLRLCSPTPQTPGKASVTFGGQTIGAVGTSLAGEDNEEDKLPFVTSAQKLRAVSKKDRRSMTPGRYSSTSTRNSTSSHKKKGSLTPSMKARIMGRKSMPAAVHFAPLAPPAPSAHSSASPPAKTLNLGSHSQPLGLKMPDGEGVAPFMAPSIYPPLPPSTPMTTTIFRPDANAPPVPPMPMPGSWLHSHSTVAQEAMNSAGSTAATPARLRTTAATSAAQAAFAFGTDSPGVSSVQFTSAAQAILDQMNAKLPEGQRIGEDLLKGRKATVRPAEGERKTSGGWGLSAKGKDRFAAAHEKEFAKMQGIGEKPKNRSGLPSVSRSRSHAPLQSTSAPRSLVGLAAALDGPTATPGKKRKLAEGRSVTTLLASASGTSLSVADMPSAPNGAPMPTNGNGNGQSKLKRRLSQGPEAIMGSLRVAGRSMMNLLEGDGERVEGVKTPMKRKGTLKQRLSLLRPFKRAAAADDPRLSAQGIAHIAAEVRERRLSARSAHLGTDIPTTVRSGARVSASSSLSQVVQKSTSTSTATTTCSSKPKVPKARLPSAMSTQTAITSRTASSSRTLPPRSPLPDFGQARVRPGVSSAASASALAQGAASATSSTRRQAPTASGHTATGSLSKKQSQANVIRKARPAPPPPSAFSYRSMSGIMPAGSGVPNGVEAAASAHDVDVKARETRKVSGSSSANRLMQPTAASLARMQATVRPPLPSAYGPTIPLTQGKTAVPSIDARGSADAKMGRPLPRPPSTMFKSVPITTSNPFGKGESRENLFESTFNALPSPKPRPLPTIPSMSPIKLPDTLPTSAPATGSSITPLGERPAFNGYSGIPIPSIPTSIPSTDFAYQGKPKTPPTLTRLPPRTPKGTPGKRGAYAGHTTSSAARMRTKSSIKLKSVPSAGQGLLRGVQGAGGSLMASGVRSRGDLKGEVDAQRRKAELRGRVERRAEERELREMLGGLGGGVGKVGDVDME